jgi:hypothetical protein
MIAITIATHKMPSKQWYYAMRWVSRIFSVRIDMILPKSIAERKINLASLALSNA